MIWIKGQGSKVVGCCLPLPVILCQGIDHLQQDLRDTHSLFNLHSLPPLQPLQLRIACAHHTAASTTHMCPVKSCQWSKYSWLMVDINSEPVLLMVKVLVICHDSRGNDPLRETKKPTS